MQTSKYLTREDVQSAIAELDRECKLKQEALALQFKLTYEKLRPANILKNTLSDISHTPGLGRNLLSTSVGLGVGYLTNRLLINNPAGVARKIAGTAIQLGLSSLVARKMGRWKYALRNIFSKKEKNPETAA